MKTLLFSLTVCALALANSVQADDAKKADCCADKAKATAKAGCADKCCGDKLAKRVDMTVKGATLLVQK